MSNKNWQPTASLENLHLRAKILTQIRNFFADRGVLEVETPLLCSASVTDPHIASIKTQNNRYLQTSPEFAMKRLLAAQSGPIYQICKAFRHEEVGRQHNPEFTMLEWYRPNFDHHDLMNEMDALLQMILKKDSAERLSYAEVFVKYLNIDPHKASIAALKNCAAHSKIVVDKNINQNDRDIWLNLLLTHVIEPHLGKEKPLFIYDYPATQAALARVRDGNPTVAERFEVYFKGIELANGFHELTNANEQRRRFLADQKQRAELGYPAVPLDEYLLAALAAGFPNCAGVALGIDRLIMLAANAKSIAEVVSFTWDHV